MEYKNFQREVMSKGRKLVYAYEPGTDKDIDYLPCLIIHRIAEISAAGKATGSGNEKRKDVGFNLYSTFSQIQKEAKYPSEIVLFAHLIGRIMNEYDKRLSQEPMTWKELQRKMEIVFNRGPNVFQDVIRGAIELGYRGWYSFATQAKWHSTLNTARKWARRGPKRPNLVLLPSREEIQQFAKEG